MAMTMAILNYLKDDYLVCVLIIIPFFFLFPFTFRTKERRALQYSCLLNLAGGSLKEWLKMRYLNQ